MTDTQKVNWEEPVHQIIENPNLPVQRIKNHDDVIKRCKETVAAGFGENAIVVLRYEHPFRCLQPYNWGMVTHVNKFCNTDYSKFKPLCVRWFASGTIGYFDMDELLLIQEPFDEASLKMILDCQDPPWMKKE